MYLEFTITYKASACEVQGKYLQEKSKYKKEIIGDYDSCVLTIMIA